MLSLSSMYSAALLPAATPLASRVAGRSYAAPRMAFGDADEGNDFELGDWRREQPKAVSSVCDYR